MRTRAGTPLTLEIETLGFVGPQLRARLRRRPRLGPRAVAGPRTGPKRVVVDMRDPAVTGRIPFGVVDHVARADLRRRRGLGDVRARHLRAPRAVGLHRLGVGGGPGRPAVTDPERAGPVPRRARRPPCARRPRPATATSCTAAWWRGWPRKVRRPRGVGARRPRVQRHVERDAALRGTVARAPVATARPGAAVDQACAARLSPRPRRRARLPRLRPRAPVPRHAPGGRAHRRPGAPHPVVRARRPTPSARRSS